MTQEEIEIPSVDEVVELITQYVFVAISTEPMVDRDTIRQSVLRAFEELRLIEST